MYYEYRYVRVDGTFKIALLVVGAIAAPFALAFLPAEDLKSGDVVAWVILLALTGALIGTMIGYAIDTVVHKARRG